jgi:hypothetical protein
MSTSHLRYSLYLDMVFTKPNMMGSLNNKRQTYKTMVIMVIESHYPNDNGTAHIDVV